jgi:hypothetical protein
MKRLRLGLFFCLAGGEDELGTNGAKYMLDSEAEPSLRDIIGELPLKTEGAGGTIGEDEQVKTGGSYKDVAAKPEPDNSNLRKIMEENEAPHPETAPGAETREENKTEGAGDAGPEPNILIDTYKNMRNNPDIVGQAHHLSQNAAFRDVIPKNDGLSVELEGNAFKDIGSPHYSAHKNLESFWNSYRPNGDQYGGIPTISDYNSALYDSLRAAGLTDTQAKSAVQSAIRQQSQYGLVDDSLVPRIPGRINFKK